jgi:hypothetical protein
MPYLGLESLTWAGVGFVSHADVYVRENMLVSRKGKSSVTIVGGRGATLPTYNGVRRILVGPALKEQSLDRNGFQAYLVRLLTSTS